MEPASHNRQPGDNPNKFRSKRKNKRPNFPVEPITPSSSSEDYFKWCDPLPEPVPFSISELMDLTEEVVASVDLDPKYPYSITKDFNEITNQMSSSMDVRQRYDQLGNHLFCQSYMKCAKKVFCSADNTLKTHFQNLKAVNYDDTPVIKEIGAAISILGNFSTKLGRVEINTPYHNFVRWVTTGCALFEELNCTPERRLEIIESYANKFYTNLPDFNEAWKSATTARLHSMLRVNMLIPNTSFTMTTSPKQPDENLDQYDLRTPPWVQDRGELITLQTIEEQTRRPFPQSVVQTLSSIHPLADLTTFDSNSLKNRFVRWQESYLKIYKLYEFFWETVASPAGDRGYSAQLVSRTSLEGSLAHLPVSHADRSLGHLFSPALNVNVNTCREFTSQKGRNVHMNHFVQRGLKTPFSK